MTTIAPTDGDNEPAEVAPADGDNEPAEVASAKVASAN